MKLLPDFLDKNKPPLIVAELSGNHGGDIQKAFELIDCAVENGADAVKIQTYKAETITVDSRDDRFLLKDGIWKGKYLYDLYKDAMTPWEWHAPLAERARERGISLFSSPFDETAVHFLEEEISPVIYKIASFEMNHFPMLEVIGSTGKPVMASVGVSEEREIAKSLDVLRTSGCPEVILLHCVSDYPASAENFNLSRMSFLHSAFEVPVGLSDHSPGSVIPIAATVLGARVIEKHLTLDRDPRASDSSFSMLPEEFNEMCRSVRIAFDSLHLEQSESTNRSSAKFLKRSILVSHSIRKGDIFTECNLRVARPGDGLCPSKWNEVLGKKSTRSLDVGHPLSSADYH